MANVRIVLLENVSADEAMQAMQKALPAPVAGPVLSVVPALPPPALTPEKRRNGRPQAEPGDDSIRGRILESIQVYGPMSSIQLTHKTGFEMAQVSTACSRLRESGRLMQAIDAEEQGGDGTRRWLLPGRRWNRSAKSWE